MRVLYLLFIFLFTVFCSYIILAQVNYEKSKPTMEKGKLIIKVKEGIGPLEKQEGSVSFGIPSLDQKVSMYEVNKLEKMFIHKPIPKNSGLPDLSRIYQIEFPEKYNVVIVANEFSKDPNIEYAEPIPIIYLAHVPNDPLFVQQWYLNKIQAPLAWDIHKGEEGDSVIILSISDTGCRYQHPDLGQNIWNNLGEDFDGDGHTFEWNGSTWVFDPGDINNIDDDGNGFVDDLIGWNFDGNNMYPSDGDGHGTAVAGFTAATTNNNLGIASISYNLKVMPVRGIASFTNLYNSLIYAAENGADVINCSWGGEVYSEAYKEVVEYVNGLGSIIVAAAHNYNSSIPIYPASYPYVISVAAVDSQNVKANYTNYGPSIDVSAPGPLTTQPFITLNFSDGYGYVTLGTSFATPIVTGLTGLIKSYHPTWTTDQIVKQLLYTTDNIDQINPGFEHLLGTGKVNAYNSLADSDLTITPELKINMTSSSSTLSGDSKALYPNSVMNLSIMVQNYSHFLDANPLTITLTSNNPDIQIIDGEYTGLVAANSIVELLNEFQIQIAPNAATTISTLSFNATGNLPIVAGNLFEIKVIINPRGTLVWEGVENGQDYSGEYIKNYLTSNSYPVIYTTEDILSFVGMDAVFLSFGNFGSAGANTVFDNYKAAIVQEYLESGGKVYLEGGEALGWDQADNIPFLNLFGLSSAIDGSTNLIDNLQGQAGTLTEGILFTASTQVNNTWIDKYFINSNGLVSFKELPYGDVGVQNSGSYEQKTFCFSYALAELVDAQPPSTKNDLLQKILDFFGLEPLQLPSTPILFSPPDQSEVDSSSVMFSWFSSQQRVTKYWIEIDTTEQFTSSFIDSTVTDTNYVFNNLQTTASYWWRVKAYNAVGWGEFSEVWKFTTNIVSVESEEIPIEYALQQNYPNPFNPSTVISWQSPVGSHQSLKVFDVLGNELATLVNEYKPAGTYEVEFNAAALPSGVYFYQLKASEYVNTKKMLLLK